MRRSWRLLVLPTVVACVVLAGCGGEGRENPILRLSVEESLTKGKELLEKKKYFQAREYLTHAFEIEPNSAAGREALLLVADAHFFQGGSQNLIKAEAKYRDFLNRFPTTDRGAYVQYQIATSQLQRMRRPDRDQSISLGALEAYEDLIRLYPSSTYVEEAEAQVEKIRESLAEAEYLVGVYNFRRGKYVKCGVVCFKAALRRLEGLNEAYPGYSKKEELYFHLAAAAAHAGEEEKAQRYGSLLREGFPESKLVKALDKEERRAVKRLERAEQKLERQRSRMARKAAPESSDGAEADGSGEPEDDSDGGKTP